ncbi:MAG: DUF3617 domain-containing protein [Pseudomonadota bacterium]|jgi:hypothetical protein|nr:DUF3617 domain-containing protein [Pseudomonadota bacterium]
MPQFPIRLLFLTAALAAAGTATAQPRAVEPGLWEMQVRNPELDAARAQMEKQLAEMPPAMRKQMEQMMAGQGIALAGKGVRACITPEQARRGPDPGMAEEGCTQDLDWSGNVGRYEMKCKDGRHGRGEVTFVSDKAWKGWGEFTDPARGSEPMKFDYSGEWLGSDCGNVAPIRER